MRALCEPDDGQVTGASPPGRRVIVAIVGAQHVPGIERRLRAAANADGSLLGDGAGDAVLTIRD